MIDIHCHIIPEVDDGSDSIVESIKMARLAYENGTNAIVATPHCNQPRSYINYWDESLYNRFIKLQEAIKDSRIPIEILPGQEILCTNSTLTLLKQNKIITINKSKYVLVEFEFEELTHSVINKVLQIASNGYIPIIAHPERYSFVTEDFQSLFKLKASGALLQINKGSIYGGFGRSAFINSRRMLEHHIVDFVASDAHSPYMRTTEMSKAHEIISEIYSLDYAEMIFDINPEAVLLNKNINYY